MEYKIGDRVKSLFHQNKGMLGTIVSADGNAWLIRWDDVGIYGSRNVYSRELLELIVEPKDPFENLLLAYLYKD